MIKQSTIKFRVEGTLKKAFEKVVGKKAMSNHLRREMEKVVKKANKIHHA